MMIIFLGSVVAVSAFVSLVCWVGLWLDSLAMKKQRTRTSGEIVDLDAYRSWRDAVKIYESTKITAERK